MKRIASGAVLAAFIALPALASAQDVEKGKALYTANKCQTVPRDRGQGEQEVPTRWRRREAVGRRHHQVDHRRRPSMEAKLAEKPKIHMKPYKLADADLKSLVAYMQSLK